MKRGYDIMKNIKRGLIGAMAITIMMAATQVVPPMFKKEAPEEKETNTVKITHEQKENYKEFAKMLKITDEQGKKVYSMLEDSLKFDMSKGIAHLNIKEDETTFFIEGTDWLAIVAEGELILVANATGSMYENGKILSTFDDYKLTDAQIASYSAEALKALEISSGEGELVTTGKPIVISRVKNVFYLQTEGSTSKGKCELVAQYDINKKELIYGEVNYKAD